jgi:FtsP/CotA-like multicopper oxidase with cupredoxin domain
MTPDLSTTYLGLQLASPLVPSASPLRAASTPVGEWRTAQATPESRPVPDGTQALSPPQIAPPIERAQPTTVKVELEARKVTALMNDEVAYDYWTFNGTVPGPVIRVRQGDTIELTLKSAADSAPCTASIFTRCWVRVAAPQSASRPCDPVHVYGYHCATPHGLDAHRERNVRPDCRRTTRRIAPG